MILELYIEKFCPYSIRTRIALEEKKIPFKVIDVTETHGLNLDFMGKNTGFPILREREFVINNNQTILQYIDERFPSPNLLPNQPAERAEIRMLNLRIEREWHRVYDIYRNEQDQEKKALQRTEIYNTLHAIQHELVAHTPYILSNDFTLADCSFAALMICFEQEGVEITEDYPELFAYKTRLLERESVQRSIPKVMPKRLKR